ncbi:Na/Pi cotransporter family protein [Enterovirga sp.]|uniref:Na/Pi cotransporter family protein n=1 Tax=Enterovirga sp. TaxID=2026350 RepID=UPI002C39A9BE|nr:Na/Pi cotransporter family protein [Enterovirga sp.]HMO28346.1 Na/Pi cotransporter family protein [Enterovirga sp.]
MSATRVLIELIGEVALLMWGIHMVSGGVQRAFGTDLRRVLGIGLRNRLTAFLTGVGVTAALQSSTATALMVTSFSGAGAVDLVPALAVMLGANVGTTLITQALSFDIAYIYPILIGGGVLAYRRGRSSTVRDSAQAVIGIGLMLLSLHLLVHTIAPVENSATLKAVLASITQEPLLAIGATTLFAWAAHSSVASILLVASLSGGGLVTPAATVAMVLGCNLGSALNPLVDALGKEPARLRVPVGNLANRLAGCLLVLPFLDPIARAVMSVDPSPVRLAANLHLLFNLAMAALFIGVLPLLAEGLRRLLPDRAVSDPGAALYLDEAALTTPSVALANAAREVLRMADIVEEMLRGSQGAFHRDDREKIAAISAMDDILDQLYVSVQGYVGLLAQESLSGAEAKRLTETIALAINLEHIGDIVEKNLMEMARKRIDKGHRLSPESLTAIGEMHGRLLDNLRLALAVYMSRDVDAARRLVAEKEQFRQIEREATERHFQEMRSGRPDAIRTSALQLDITRDLKRIEAHIAATAHGLLESHGELRETRLRAVPDSNSA